MNWCDIRVGHSVLKSSNLADAERVCFCASGLSDGNCRTLYICPLQPEELLPM